MAGDVSVQFALETVSMQSVELCLALTAVTRRPCQTKHNPNTSGTVCLSIRILADLHWQPQHGEPLADCLF